jgi:hypothetical protein
MATKPTDTYIFAIDTTYTAGAHPTFPVKVPHVAPDQGFVPGAGVSSEAINHMFNVCGQWITAWLKEGTSLAALNAHLMETDSLGQGKSASLSLGGTGSALVPAVLKANTGADPSNTLTIEHLAILGIAAVINATEGALDAQSSAAGHTTAVLRHTGTDRAMHLIGGTTGGANAHALTAEGGSDADAVEIISKGAAARGLVVDGSLGIGAAIEAKRNNGAPALALRNSGDPFLRGMISIESNVHPTAAVVGDLWREPGTSGLKRGGLWFQDEDGAVGSAGKMKLFASQSGHGAAHAEARTAQDMDGATPVTALALTLDKTSSQPSLPQGDYFVTISCEVAAKHANLPRSIVIFSVDSVPTKTTQLTMDFALISQWKPLSVTIKVPLAAIPVLIQIIHSTSVPGELVSIRNCEISAHGAYDT